MNDSPQHEARQPWLHQLEVAVHGNLTCLADGSGALGGTGTGLFADDRRVLSVLTLACDGHPPTAVAADSLGGLTTVFLVARHLGDPGPDPTVEIHRERRLRDAGFVEHLTLRSRTQHVVRTVLTVRVGGDGADLAAVKGGRPGAALLAPTRAGPTAVSWADERHATTVRGPGAALGVADQGPAVLTWDVTLEPGDSRVLSLEVDVARTAATPFDAEPGGSRVDWSGVAVRAQDRRVDLTVATSFADLGGLLLSDPKGATDVFAAAGSPWYLTLFGRDALWTARLVLPFGTTLALGTLRTLARRQGRVDDLRSAEEPGKILHEVRRSGFADPTGPLQLPPVYFGTVDATPLWVCLLHDAWRWGLPRAEVAALRPHLDAALGWLRRAVDASPDGFVRYVDATGGGLSNQGWKDSGDAMRTRDGSIAAAPIALIEAQAYAVDASLRAAELLEEVHGESGEGHRRWAAELAGRVRRRFWVADAAGRYLAMALDRDGAAVDGVGSNMGHVLATGALTRSESRTVADRLADPDLLGPYGIGTLGRSNPAYNPMGYHTGSVWTHDSAITALGLARDGHGDTAARVLRALVDAATRFGFRLPELYGWDDGLGRPVPYPAACRPQAWSAASAAALVTATLGLDADVPRRRLRLNPLRPSPFGALAVTGLRVGGEALTVALDADGGVRDVTAPDWLDVEVSPTGSAAASRR